MQGLTRLVGSLAVLFVSRLPKECVRSRTCLCLLVDSVLMASDMASTRPNMFEVLSWLKTYG